MAYTHNNRSYSRENSEGRSRSSADRASSRRPSGSTRNRAASAYQRAVEESRTSSRTRSRSASASGRRVSQDAPRRERTARSEAPSRYSRDAYARSSYSSRRERGEAEERTRAAGGSGRGRHSAGGRGATPPSRGRGLKPYLAALAAVVVVIAVVVVVNPFKATSSLDTSATQQQSTMNSANSKTYNSADDDALPTPIIAQSNGVDVHSAVAANDLTEILIHNASYAYAGELTTQLTEATNTEVMAKHGTGRDGNNQPTGDNWLTGEFIRCFRSTNAGPKLSAIDCGGKEGTTVYAPVTGKVVLVKQYQLYGKYDDYEVHIQPEGHSELDVVLIHLTDVSVKAGDSVTAGDTKMAYIRDVYALIGEEMQLKQYTAEGDNGNHTHIQVNLATHPEYHGLDDLKPATTIPAA